MIRTSIWNTAIWLSFAITPGWGKMEQLYNMFHYCQHLWWWIHRWRSIIDQRWGFKTFKGCLDVGFVRAFKLSSLKTGLKPIYFRLYLKARRRQNSFTVHCKIHSFIGESFLLFTHKKNTKTVSFKYYFKMFRPESHQFPLWPNMHMQYSTSKLKKWSLVGQQGLHFKC